MTGARTERHHRPSPRSGQVVLVPAEASAERPGEVAESVEDALRRFDARSLPGS